MILSWDKSYETGDVGIDRQHRELLELVDELENVQIEAMGRDETLPVFDRMMDFTFSHFDMEEDLMVRVHYPDPDQLEMINQHREFRSYARIRVLEFRSLGPQDMVQFRSFLRAWLVEHEFGLDKKLASFIRSRRSSEDGTIAPAGS